MIGFNRLNRKYFSFHPSQRAKAIGFLVFCLLALLFWFLLCPVADFETVKRDHPPSESVLLDRHHAPVQVLRLNFNIRRLNWVPLNEVSPVFLKALILSEDQRFYEHHGLDIQAMFGSVLAVFKGQSLRGASTLTMQLAALLDDSLKPADDQPRRSIYQKIQQIRLALAIEGQWTKAQILEAYINLVSFRGELQGVAAMSKGIFGQSPDALDARSSAIAVVLLKAPAAKAERVAQRACQLMQRLSSEEDCAGVDTYTKIVLSRPLAIPYDHQLAYHLARKLLLVPGEQKASTLDAAIQKAANDILKRHMLELAERQVEDGAMVVLDNETGDVLAWVGSSATTSSSAHTDGVLAPRQAGSTLKPFLYGLAIEGKWLTAASVLEDRPMSWQTGNGLYTPQNYDRQFRGLVSTRYALGSSLNVPAVSTLTLVSTERFYQLLKRLGFSTMKQTSDFYGYSLALGSLDVTLLDLANAYRTIANEGRFSPVHYQFDDKKTASQRVLDPKTAFIISDILSDQNARLHTFGRQSALDTAIWTAVKTGTSRDMRDNWCVGFSKRYTVAVWVGNFAGDPMHDVSGVSGAAPIWQAMMAFLAAYQNQTDGQPSVPDGLLREKIRFEPAFEPARAEWFLPDMAQPVFRVSDALTNDGLSIQKIHYPAPETIIAIDVDIPESRQRILFSVRDPKTAQHFSWRLNGQDIGSVSSHRGFTPVPGHHQLALIDEKGNIIDQVNFEVRSGGAKFSR